MDAFVQFEILESKLLSSENFVLNLHPIFSILWVAEIEL